MTVKLLLVAEIELPNHTVDPDGAALLRVQALADGADDISFWQPAVGRTFERPSGNSVEVFY